MKQRTDNCCTAARRFAICAAPSDTAEAPPAKKETDIKETEKSDKTQDNWVSGTYSNIVGEIAAKIAEKGDYEALIEIAPFVKQEDLDKIVKQITEKGDYEVINNIIPFISENAIQEIQK